MTETAELHLPVPLRQYLEAGCDPHVVLDDLEYLVEGVLKAEVGAPLAFARHRRAEAQELIDDRWLTEEGGELSPRAKFVHDRARVREVLLSRGDSPDAIPGGDETMQDFITRNCWRADVLEDPEARRLLMGVLHDEEQAFYERLLPHYKHPHRLLVQRAGADACDACGTPFEPDDLKAVLDDSDVGGYCFGCVTMVNEAMKAARG